MRLEYKIIEDGSDAPFGTHEILGYMVVTFRKNKISGQFISECDLGGDSLVDVESGCVDVIMNHTRDSIDNDVEVLNRLRGKINDSTE